MLQSFLVYYGLAFVLFILGDRASGQPRALRVSSGGTKIVPLVAAILFFGIISGIRYEVGADNLMYIHLYEHLAKTGVYARKDIESGFLFITEIFASANCHFSIYIGFWATIQIAFAYAAFRNERYLYPFIGLLIMTGPYYLDWMNGMRQCTVECICFWAISFLNKGKELKFIIIILLASLIHQSSLILLLCALIPRIHLRQSQTNAILLMMCILICAIVLGNTPTWIGIVYKFESLINALGYERYTDNFNFTTRHLSAFNWGPRRITILILYFTIIYYYPKLKAFFKSELMKNCFKMFFIGACTYNLLANTSLEFLRPVGYFTVFTLPMTAYLLFFQLKTKKFIPLILCLMLACSYAAFSILSGEYLNQYKFFFEVI